MKHPKAIFPQTYAKQRLSPKHWPDPLEEKNQKGQTIVKRTDQGLEAVPGYYQSREVGTGYLKHKIPVFIRTFQRRRGVGFIHKKHGKQIPLSPTFLHNYTNEQIYHMRRVNGMYKLLFWNQSQYTPLEALRWNLYLDDHPNLQHQLPIPTTNHPDEDLPLPPEPYRSYNLKQATDRNGKTHEYHWDPPHHPTIRQHLQEEHKSELQPDVPSHGNGYIVPSNENEEDWLDLHHVDF
jgi:hypothetical protein